MGHFPKGFRTFAEYNRWKQHIPWGQTVAGSGPYGIVAPAVAWWKRDTLTGNTNGASLTSWSDSSAGGWTLAVDSVAPTWSSSILGGSVTTDVTALEAFKSATFSSLANVTGYTIFAVAKATSFPNAVDTIVGTTSVGVAVGRVSGGNMFFNVGSANGGSYAYTDVTNAHVFECLYDGTGAGNSTRLFAWQDGTSKVLSYAGTVPATTGALAAGISVGNTQGASERWTGNIAEVLIVASALSATDRSTIRVALGAKYSLTVTP